MTDDQRDILRGALEQMESKAGLVWGPKFLEEVCAALRALLDEKAALKKPDPLAEMWRELSEYQEQADRDGHGESWRRMCSERTEEAAEIAQEILGGTASAAYEPWLAAMSARWAVAWWQRSIQNAQDAIGVINAAAARRRAKEAKP